MGDLMKASRKLGRFCMLALCAALLVGALALTTGAQGVTDVTAQLSPQMTIRVDGVAQTFYNASGGEVHPIVYRGTTYLPLRAVGELMGKNVNWDQSTLTVTLDGTRDTARVSGTPDRTAQTRNVSAQLRPDFTIVVDGVKRNFTDANGQAVYPLLYQGSTYLPLRAVGELMGKQVAWDSGSNTVTLSGGSLVTDADSFTPTVTPSTPPTATTPPGNAKLTADEAKAKALAHAGLKADQVIFVKHRLEKEDGRLVYDVEFYTSGKEYDYEIDANTGAVISYDYDAENYDAKQDSGNYLSEAKIKEIALAQVPGAKTSDVVKVKLDKDDGRTQYEVKIIKGGMEYEFEIDAVTGTILEQDAEPVDD